MSSVTGHVPATTHPPEITDLIAALELAHPLLLQVSALLSPYLPNITETERGHFPRPPDGFQKAVPLLIQAMKTRPHVTALAGFNGEAVSARIQGATSVSQVLSEMEELQQRLADSRLLQLSEAWRSCLTAYTVARSAEKADPTLRVVIEPMAEVFRGRRAVPVEAKDISEG